MLSNVLPLSRSEENRRYAIHEWFRVLGRCGCSHINIHRSSDNCILCVAMEDLFDSLNGYQNIHKLSHNRSSYMICVSISICFKLLSHRHNMQCDANAVYNFISYDERMRNISQISLIFSMLSSTKKGYEETWMYVLQIGVLRIYWYI